jgi:hypothetical protein
LLGADGKKKVQDYQQTMGERFLVNQFSQQVGATDLKLSDQQSEGLLQIMIDESKKTPLAGANANSAAQMETLTSANAMDQYQTRQSEINQRVLARAPSILTAGQIQELKSFMSQMLETQKAGAAMLKTMDSGE